MLKKYLTKQRIIIIVLVLALLGFGAWKIFFGKQQAVRYQTARVEKGTIVSTISASGQILVSNIIEVKTQASGQVSKVYVEDGDHVTKGQKIAEITLDTQGQQKAASSWSSYLSAKNAADSANVTFYTLQSQEFSANQKFINDAVARNLKTDDPTYIQENADWLAAEAKYKNQQSVITQANAALNSTWLSYQLVSSDIIAPATGAVGDLTVAAGMNVGATDTTSQKLGVVRQNGLPLASFNISEIDVAKVKKGQKATIILDALPDKTFTGKVIGIDRTGVVSQGVTNYPATIQFDTEAQEVLPNMAANVNIILEAKSDVLIVPSAAVQGSGDQSYVRILRAGKEVQVPVQLGLSSDTQTEILSGISEGDEVITGTVAKTAGQAGGVSPFGGGFGGGALRPGGFGGGRR